MDFTEIVKIYAIFQGNKYLRLKDSPMTTDIKSKYNCEFNNTFF